jgi:hypothetical protein
MKKLKISALISMLIISCLSIFLACSNGDSSLTVSSKDNEITTTFIKDPNEQKRESEIPPYLPEVESIELIGVNTSLGIQLKNDIESIKFFDVNYNNIERVKLSGIDSEVFTIPFVNGRDELVVFRNNDMISFVIGNEEELSNGNTKFTMKNYKNEIFYNLEQDRNDKFGNFEINDKEHGFFQLTENTNIINTSSSRQNCIHLVNFNACMQCAWDECSSSWVCGAALALKPVAIIAAAATFCAASAILSIH